MIPTPPRPARSFAIPLWAEASLIAVFAIMAVIESLHAQWFFAAIFIIAALGFGAGLISRFGKKDA